MIMDSHNQISLAGILENSYNEELAAQALLLARGSFEHVSIV
jgi:hypothetical protein